MKTWRALWHLLRYRPWLYFLNMLGLTVQLLFDMVSGLLSRAYFNLLTGARSFRMGLGMLIIDGNVPAELVATAAQRRALAEGMARLLEEGIAGPTPRRR